MACKAPANHVRVYPRGFSLTILDSHKAGREEKKRKGKGKGYTFVGASIDMSGSVS